MGKRIQRATKREIDQARKKTADALEQKALTRRDRYRVTERTRLNPQRIYDEPYFLSRYAHTLTKSRQRFLAAPLALRVGNTIESPTTLARDYLKLTYVRAPGLRGIARTIIPEAMKRTPALPLYAEPCKFREGFYLDVYHCYFSILLTVGWNVAYVPRKYFLAGLPPLDFPFPEHSVARNSLVSCSMHSDIVRFIPPKPTAQSIGSYNPVLNETITVLIRDVLHAIAWQARALGAVYWHTDGCIAPSQQSAEAIEQMVGDWGLEITYKAIGPGQVWGVGSYCVGDKTTVRQVEARGYDGLIELDYARWLQTRFSRFASMREDK